MLPVTAAGFWLELSTGDTNFWPLDPKTSPPEEPGAGWSRGRVSPEAGRAAGPSTHLLSVSSSNTGAPPLHPLGGKLHPHCCTWQVD